MDIQEKMIEGTMKTELVFKLEKEPDGYRTTFAPNCKIDVRETKGILYLDYNKLHPIGMFENLRAEGECIFADIELFERQKCIEHRFEYAIQGSVLSKNDNLEATEVKIFSVSAVMKSES